MSTISILAACAYSLLGQAAPPTGFAYVAGYGYPIGRLHQGVRTEVGPAENMGRVLQAEGGQTYTMALRTDGTVAVWGNSGEGEFGQGSTSTRYSDTPFTVQRLPAAKYIKAGLANCFAIAQNGDLYGWGANGSGELGTTAVATKQGYPIKIEGISDVNSIGVGNGFVVGLKKDGTVWTWGSGTYGTLGDGTTVARKTPGLVPGLTNVVQVVAGGHRAFALKADGTVWAWGLNNSGTLGVGSPDSLVAAAKQVQGASLIKEIACGTAHTLLLRDDGMVMSYGLDDAGQLGDPSITNTYPGTSQPAIVPGLTTVKHIGAGGSASFAIDEDGSVSVFGNSEGMVPDFRSRAPVKIPHLEHVVSAQGGPYHAVFVSATNAPIYGYATPNPVVGPYGPSTYRIVIAEPPAADLPLTVTSSDPSAIVVSSTVIPAGADHVDLQVDVPNRVYSYRGVMLRASSGVASAPALLGVDIQTLTLSIAGAGDILAGDLAGGYVKLNFPAPEGGIDVHLASNLPSRITLPETVHIEAGSTSAAFPFQTKASVTNYLVTFTADAGDRHARADAYIKGNSIASMTFAKAKVQGTHSVSLTIRLAETAPVGGRIVHLLTGGSAYSIPDTCIIPEGSRAGTVKMTTTTVAEEMDAFVTAYIDSSYPKVAKTVIEPANIESLTLGKSVIHGGDSTKLTIQFDGPAASDLLYLSAGDPSVVLPPTVIIPNGAKKIVVDVATTSIPVSKKVSIRVRLRRVAVRTTLLVASDPPELVSITASPQTLKGGAGTHITITLAANAYADGATIKLRSQDPSLVSVPATVSILPGHSRFHLKLTTAKVDTRRPVRITAEGNGVKKYVVLTLNPK